MAVHIAAGVGRSVPGGLQAVLCGQALEDDFGWQAGVQMARVFRLLRDFVTRAASHRDMTSVVFQVNLVGANTPLGGRCLTGQITGWRCVGFASVASVASFGVVGFDLAVEVQRGVVKAAVLLHVAVTVGTLCVSRVRVAVSQRLGWVTVACGTTHRVIRSFPGRRRERRFFHPAAVAVSVGAGALVCIPGWIVSLILDTSAPLHLDLAVQVALAAQL